MVEFSTLKRFSSCYCLYDISPCYSFPFINALSYVNDRDVCFIAFFPVLFITLIFKRIYYLKFAHQISFQEDMLLSCFNFWS